MKNNYDDDSKRHNISGILTTSQLNQHGFKNYEITRLCKKGVLVRLKQGYFCRNDEFPCDEEIIHTIYPDGILCQDSALFHYGYTDRTPLMWTIAFTRTVSRSRFHIDFFDLKPYYVEEHLLNLGKIKIDINGFPLYIYDRERVICDCFKYRTKMDSEQFNKAIFCYVKDDKKNLYNLISYAKKMRIYDKVIDLIGVMVNER